MGLRARNLRDGGNYSALPKREGEGLGGPTPAPVNNALSERSRRPGSTSCLTAPKSDTLHLWLLSGVESAIYGPNLSLIQPLYLRGCYFPPSHRQLRLHSLLLSFRAGFMPPRTTWPCSRDILAPLDGSDSPEPSVAWWMGWRRGSGCTPRFDKLCYIHTGVTWTLL